MASAQDVNTTGYENGQFVDPYDYGTGWTGDGSIQNWFMKTFAGYDKSAKYQETRERQAINSARAWEEYLDSTKYQRAVKDLEAAGLNPWLAVQSGVSGGSASASTDTGGNSAKNNKSSNNLAALLLAVAKLLA